METYPKNPRGLKPTDLFRVVNPTNVDFAFEYLDASNQPVPYEIKAGEVRKWPRYLVSYYATHFIDLLLNRQGQLTNDMNAREETFNLLILGPAEDIDTPLAHAQIPEAIAGPPKAVEPIVIQKTPAKAAKPRKTKTKEPREVVSGPPAEPMRETRSPGRAPNEPLSLGGGTHDLPELETEA